MSDTAPDKMKVADLRAALQERSLDTKGTKPVLVARLQEALDAEKPKEEEKVAEEAVAETTEEAGDAKTEEANMDTDEVTVVAEGKTEEKLEEEKKEGEKKEEGKKEETKGTKRKHEEEPFVVKENEPEIADDFICLDWYNSDLSMRINDDYTTALPYTRDGWGYCYAGARATHGFKVGKVWYEVKYVDNMDVKVEKETSTFDLRVGWSTNNSSMMLGDSETSWCYSSAEGKMANAAKFEEYGEKFTKNDVIGCFLDFGEEEISMTFTKNGEDQGDAFQIPRADFPADTALFPHILTRNVKFAVNFGKDKAGEEVADWKEKEIEGDYVKAAKVEGEKERGTARIEKREDCEMIMMVGLPGSGKTTWVDNHVKENADKHYNVISTSEMFKKMTVNGEAKKKVFKGKWDLVIQKATRSLQEAIRSASTRRRNVIIDQTNVFPNAQKRKARPFEGFVRRCVVVVPSDDDYKARVKAQETAGCKDIPDDAIMEMKANFALPEEAESPFKEIQFVELDREKAKEVVDLYNKVAKEKGFGKKAEERRAAKRGKFNARGTSGRGNFRGNVRGMRGGFNPRGMPMRGMRGGPMMRGMRGNMRGMQNMRGMRGGPRGGGPSPWAANKNMGARGGGMHAWNKNAGMNNMGMNNMGGGMGGRMNNMGGGMGMGGGMNNMGMGGMGGGMSGGMGGMGGMGGGMNTMGMGMNNMSSGMGGMGGGMSSMGGGMGGMGGGMNNMGMGGGMNNMGMSSGMGGMGMNNMSSGMSSGMGGGSYSSMGMNNRMGMQNKMGGGGGGGMGAMNNQRRNQQSYGSYGSQSSSSYGSSRGNNRGGSYRGRR